MKVFISWSGERSKSLANALRDWIPMVLQYVEPWVSDKDISAGDRWAQKIAGELEISNFGIICITPENLHSEWILFESGALSKSMLDAKVIPLLYGLELSDLSGPLSQFQAQKLGKAGIMEIIKTINKVSRNKTSNQIVNQLVPALWPSLQEALEKIPNSKSSEKHMRPQHEILEELVTGVRGINSRIRDIEPNLTNYDRANKNKKSRTFHPLILKAMQEVSDKENDPPLQLLVLAGLYRTDFPWLAEVLTEAYREIREKRAESAKHTLFKIRRLVEHMEDFKPLYRFSGNSKELYSLVNELPRYLDIIISLTHPDIKTDDAS